MPCDACGTGDVETAWNEGEVLISAPQVTRLLALASVALAAALCLEHPLFAQPFNEEIVHAFLESPDGAEPTATLLQASDGHFYGTTVQGGRNDGGAVFEISGPPGARIEGVVHTFTGGADGANPFGSLIEASDGNLYGTTFRGGASGQGTVFRISDLSGVPVETVIYNFTGGADGSNPSASLLEGADGNLYGTTISGGLYRCVISGGGCGTVFKISKLADDPQESVVYSFLSGTDGSLPAAPLIQASDGNLYGTTTQGGLSNCTTFQRSPIGCGTVFEISNLSGTPAESVIYRFTNGTDGYWPQAALFQATDGNLYGTVSSGGESSNGAVYKIGKFASTPKFSIFYSFTGGADGRSPDGSLTEASDGNFYGTTAAGGVNGAGTVFRIDNVSGTSVATPIHSFPDGFDGASPEGSLTQASDGKLYGTTAGGGVLNFDWGVVFSLDIGAKGLPGPCIPSATTLCIDGQPGDKRFQVQVGFQTAQGGGSSGSARSVSLAPVGITRGGAFWFFSPDNPELLVKVLDGCTINDREWFFASAATNVAFIITVTDTKTGEQKLYANADLSVPEPIQDTSYSSCAIEGQETESLAQPTRAQVSNDAAAAPIIFTCEPSATTLCIDGQPGDRRFKIEVNFETSQGGGASGSGQAIPLSPVGITHGGAFWFFSHDNPEMLVKVLDGCAINGQKWFFASAATNVGYTLTLTDTATAQQKIYVNADLHPADPILDTAAFATCP